MHLKIHRLTLIQFGFEVRNPTDHLGGTNLVTDTTGAILETLDYYPYGQARLDIKTGSFTGERRKFIREEHDAGTGLDYLNARYYNPSQGQFTSQDPVFLGNPNVF